MNIDKVLDIAKDIKEIEDVLNPNVIFDRIKAEDIIRKHNATDEVVVQNLIVIRNILIVKLQQESSKKEN